MPPPTRGGTGMFAACASQPGHTAHTPWMGAAHSPQPPPRGTAMRRTTPTALLLAAGLALTACSTSKTVSKPGPRTTPSARDQFLTAIHQAHITSWATAAPTDDEIAAYPPKWCAQLAAGHSVSEILSVRSGLWPSGPNWVTKGPDADQVLILGVTAYCPKYHDQVVQQAQAGGY